MNYQEQEVVISDLEIQIDRLRALYEQYFMGIEKLEPQIPRKQVERTFRLLRKERINNTALRYRFLMLVQRYNTMENYWRRVVRQIEEGTYRRLVMRSRPDLEALPRVERRKKRRRKKLPEHEVDLDELEDTNPHAEIPDGSLGYGFDADESTQPSIAELLSDPQLGRPITGGRLASAPHAPPVSVGVVNANPGVQANRHQANARVVGLTEGRIHDIYREYVSARQRCNQPTHGLTIDKVTEQIRQQEATLRRKHGKDVDFQVVVKDGRAILKAVKKP